MFSTRLHTHCNEKDASLNCTPILPKPENSKSLMQIDFVFMYAKNNPVTNGNKEEIN